MAEQKEILESIRDALKGGDDDILDLTQKVNEDGSITELTPKHMDVPPMQATPLRVEPSLNLAKDEPVEEEHVPEPIMPEVLPEATDDILSEIDSILSSKVIDEKVELEFPLKPPPVPAAPTAQKFEIADEFEATPELTAEPIIAVADIMPRSEAEIEHIERKQMDNENVTADQAKDSISELMGKLKKSGKESPAREHGAPFRSGATVEDLVVEMLTPMMKEWLDNNLPKLVKETVQKEIAKLIPKE